MLAGKAGQTHEFASDRDGGRAGDEGRASPGDAGVEEDKDHFMELGALLAGGLGFRWFQKSSACRSGRGSVENVDF